MHICVNQFRKIYVNWNEFSREKKDVTLKFAKRNRLLEATNMWTQNYISFSWVVFGSCL